MAARKWERKLCESDVGVLSQYGDLIDQVLNQMRSLQEIIGSREDMRQIACMAILQSVKSKGFALAINKEGYLSRVIRGKLVDSISQLSLIRLPYKQFKKMAQAVRVELMGLGMDQLPAAQPVEDFDSLKTARDVAWAIDQLPPTIRQVIGHLFGVADYAKLQVADIARRMNLKISTVNRYAVEGRCMLRSLLEERGCVKSNLAELANDKSDC